MNKHFDRKRRQLLKIMGGAGLAATTPLLIASQKPSEIITKPIPSSGERLPVIGLGTSRVFNVGRDVAELSKLREVVRILASVENSMLDTSPMYGEAERVTGDLVENLAVRKRLFFATKIWTDGRQAARLGCRDWLRKLGAVFPKIRHFASRNHLRHPCHQQSKAYAGESGGRKRGLGGQQHEEKNAGVLRSSLGLLTSQRSLARTVAASR